MACIRNKFDWPRVDYKRYLSFFRTLSDVMLVDILRLPLKHSLNAFTAPSFWDMRYIHVRQLSFFNVFVGQWQRNMYLDVVFNR